MSKSIFPCIFEKNEWYQMVMKFSAARKFGTKIGTKNLVPWGHWYHQLSTKPVVQSNGYQNRGTVLGTWYRKTVLNITT